MVEALALVLMRRTMQWAFQAMVSVEVIGPMTALSPVQLVDTGSLH
jgi:hypothetical protein